MGINKSWQTTLAFRRFREKTFELSRVYWTQQLGVDALTDRIKNEDPDLFTAQVINASFEYKMHPEKIGETMNWMPNFMDRNRLYLIVIYTAFLEQYLKDITMLHLFSLGHILNKDEVGKQMRLTTIGEALGKPIIRSSTVPDMINYASELFEIDFGVNGREWIKFYKIRCLGAHLGGIATLNFINEVGNTLAVKPTKNKTVGITWDELRMAMRYGDEIAAMIDSKISSKEVRTLEAEEVLRELYINKKLPKQNTLWQYLHDEYSISQINRKSKNYFIDKFYTTPKREALAKASHHRTTKSKP